MSYLEALQTTLAAEHAAVYVLGYLGAQTSSSQQPTLAATVLASYDAHRARRDQLVAKVLDLGGTPVAAAPAYALPNIPEPKGGGDDGPDSAVAAAVTKRARQLERGCAATYDYLVASSPSAQRRFAIGLLLDAAVRGLAFDAEPQTYPGR